MLKVVRAAGLALGPVLLTTVSATAGEYQCRLDGSSIRIAVEVKKQGHTLPCEVIAENDSNDRSVLYNARYDRDYCPGRLEKTRAELEGEGWVCQKTSDTNVVEGEGRLLSEGELTALNDDSPTQGIQSISSSQRCELDGKFRRLKIEVEDPEQGRPCSLIYWSETDESEAGDVLWRAEHDAEFCPKRMSFIVEKWENDGWTCSADDATEVAALSEDQAAIAPASEVTAETEEAKAETEETPFEPTEEELAEQSSPTIEIAPSLKAVIEADARRIGEWMEVEADIEVAAFGDLNADGKDDAVIFLDYQSEQASYRQYLMSYLNADESYELAGVKLLTGVNPPPGQAQVEEIDDGVIWLKVAEANGAPSDKIGYKLRDQQLVEVEASE